jgi:hypothetical protein
MSANRFASLAYDDDDDEISGLLPIKVEPIIHVPTTPPFAELPPSIQKPLTKVSIKNLKPRVSRSYSFYEIANPIRPNVYAMVDDTVPPPTDAPPTDAPPSSPLHSSDTTMNTLADRLRSTLQKEEAQKTNRHFDEARTFEMSTVITGQRFRRTTPLNNFRILEPETKPSEIT